MASYKGGGGMDVERSRRRSVVEEPNTDLGNALPKPHPDGPLSRSLRDGFGVRSRRCAPGGCGTRFARQPLRRPTPDHAVARFGLVAERQRHPPPQAPKGPAGAGGAGRQSARQEVGLAPSSTHPLVAVARCTSVTEHHRVGSLGPGFLLATTAVEVRSVVHCIVFSMMSSFSNGA